MFVKTFQRKKIWIITLGCGLLFLGLLVRLVFLMVIQSDYYTEKAVQLHERERDIKAARGRILDAKGTVVADNRTVCTISVIHSQISDPEGVIAMLVKELELPEETVRKRVEKVSSIERVQSNVDKEIGDRIRTYEMAGVKVDEDYKRYYPFGSLASKVLGFTGGDNQGILGLEVEYEEYLKGINGQILTTTDARGIELEAQGERRLEPVAGYDLRTSLDVNMQLYAQQAAERVLEEKQADRVTILLMNPQTGAIYTMVNIPEYDLNHPFTEGLTQDEQNQVWRNPAINDTYEPGSTFKIFTATAGLEEGVVSLEDTFQCGGFRVVEDRRIHCHKRTGHGSETFLQGAENSCNPVFIDVGLRLGVDNVYKYFRQMGLLDKTGIDLPGEAGTIMHDKKNVGLVELATISFGQSFQLTPIALATMASTVINGGNRITPHFGVALQDEAGNVIKTLEYETKSNVISKETSDTMRFILEKVVSEGSGKNAYIEGYTVGGKTATSQTLPRSANRYISSFIGFAPADDPQILGLCIIENPQGIYYGGTIAAPVIQRIFTNALPYLGIEKTVDK
ncbi:MAG: penicillin-binding transpeptidase domain-containing protein [Lachnospiraceae bacterium]|nr:penicillin-binding transpeptidase domain-containing protein [Lachnospiraceae bacterium]